MTQLPFWAVAHSLMPCACLHDILIWPRAFMISFKKSLRCPAGAVIPGLVASNFKDFFPPLWVRKYMNKVYITGRVYTFSKSTELVLDLGDVKKRHQWWSHQKSGVTFPSKMVTIFCSCKALSKPTRRSEVFFRNSWFVSVSKWSLFKPTWVGNNCL